MRAGGRGRGPARGGRGRRRGDGGAGGAGGDGAGDGDGGGPGGGPGGGGPGDARQRNATALRLALLIWALIIVLQGENAAEERRTGAQNKLRGETHGVKGAANASSIDDVGPTEKKRPTGGEERGPFTLLEDILAERVSVLESFVGDLHDPPSPFPRNLSGTLHGTWTLDEERESSGMFADTSWHASMRAISAVEENDDFKPEADGAALPFRAATGDVELRLDFLKTWVPGLQYASGTLALVDGQIRSSRDIYTYVAGFYLEKRGALMLYVASPEYKSPHVGIDFLIRDAVEGQQTRSSTRNNLIKALAPADGSGENSSRGGGGGDKGADGETGKKSDKEGSIDALTLANERQEDGTDVLEHVKSDSEHSDDNAAENWSGGKNTDDVSASSRTETVADEGSTSQNEHSSPDARDALVASSEDRASGADTPTEDTPTEGSLAADGAANSSTQDPLLHMIGLLDEGMRNKEWWRLWDTELGLSKSQIKRKARANLLHGAMPQCFFALNIQVGAKGLARGEANLDAVVGNEPGSLRAAGRTPASRLRRTSFHGSAESWNCQSVLELELETLGDDIGELLSKANDFFSLDLPLTVIAGGAVLVQRLHTSSPPRAATVSLLAIGGLAILDGCLALAYLSSGLLVEKLGASAVFVALAKLLLVSPLEMHYMMLVWRGRHPQTAWDTWAEMQRLQTMLQRRFFAALLFTVALAFMLADFHRTLWFVALSFWVPQIVCNITTNSATQISPFFVLGISLPHLFVPLYIYACPRNFVALLLTSPSIGQSPVYAAFLASWVFLQMAALLVQRYWSPHAFVPARFLPPKYDYNRKIPERLRDTQCAICLLPVTGVDEEHMITPCNHLFHRDCLRVWINEKLECPTCRAVLPPVQ